MRTLLVTRMDAFQRAVCAELQQLGNGSVQPLFFCSYKLQEAQTHYNIFGGELFVIHLAIKHFNRIFECRQFLVYAGQRLLTYALSFKGDRYSPRYPRYISQFRTDAKELQNLLLIRFLTWVSVKWLTHRVLLVQDRRSTKNDVELLYTRESI